MIFRLPLTYLNPDCSLYPSVMKKVIVDPMLDPDELTYNAMNIPITDASCAIKIMYIPNPLVENQ